MSVSSISRRLPTSQLLVGVIVILAGLLLLLETTGVAPTRSALRYVPSLFVLVGVWALVRGGLRNVVGPAVLIAVAGAWQLVALDYATVDQVVTFWPLLVIAFGLSIVLGQFRPRVTATDDAFATAFAVFGSVAKRSTSSAFLGADLTAAFGGTELDLRDAAIEDSPARITAVAAFGGVEIVVPGEWNVRMDVVPVFGDASDERPRREREHDELDLVVTGFVAFGDVSVTD